MKYIVGYNGFEIIRAGSEVPWKIYKDGKLATSEGFRSFGDARRECDQIKPLRYGDFDETDNEN